MNVILIASVIGLLVLGGCSLNDRMRDYVARANSTEITLQSQHQGFGRLVSDAEAKRRSQSVDRPWIVGRAQPLARELTLPVALRTDVKTTLLFSDGPLDLSDIAQRITMATGIPVHVRSEALLSPDMFMSRLASPSPKTSASRGLNRVNLAGESEPLANILDRLAAALDVSWAYRQKRIEFYRTETRVFNVRALTLESRADASLGLQSANTQDSGFSSASRTTLSSSSEDTYSVIRARIEPFLTHAGVLVAQPGASGVVVVTDTPEALDQIAAYIDRENQILTRRVRLVFEEITLATTDSAQAALDWDLIFSSARLAASVASGGGSVVDAGIAAMELSHGPFKGSEAIVAALSKVGRVVRRSSVPVLTLNRRPVTHAVRTTFSYIDRIDTTALGDGAGALFPSVSVSQKEETVGSLLTLVPDAQDDGRILLSVAYDNTVAQPIKSVKFGDKNNPLQLQQVTIDGNGTVQQLVVQPGQPVLISGFDRTHEETEDRRLGPDLPLLLGGSGRVSREHLITVIVITAQVEEGV